MLWMLLIGWIVLLPAIVVAGLYVSSTVLGRRRAALHAYEGLFADEDASESTESMLEQETRESVAEPPTPLPAHGASQTADAAPAVRPTVAARY